MFQKYFVVKRAFTNYLLNNSTFFDIKNYLKLSEQLPLTRRLTPALPQQRGTENGHLNELAWLTRRLTQALPQLRGIENMDGASDGQGACGRIIQ